MGKGNKEVMGLTIGLDLGDEWSQVCVVNAEGEVVEEGRVRTKAEALEERFGSMGPARIAMEVGTHSGWVSRVLRGKGHEVIVANPRKLRAIYENEKKSDQGDAEYLARIARWDPKLLWPVRHRGEKTQKYLEAILKLPLHEGPGTHRRGE